MTERRAFIKRIAVAAGAAGVERLLAAQRAFGADLRTVVDEAKRTADRWSNLRARYLLDPDVIYLNHGSIGTIPRAVHEAQVRYLAACETNPWLHMWGGEWEEPRERVREKAARLLGCGSAELALTHNTTEGFNTLASGLPLGSGDEVVFSSLNHDGASVCWFHQAAAKGFAVKRFAFPVRDVPSMTADDVLNVYDRHLTKKTRVLVFPHVDNVVGLRYPAKRLTALARSKGVEFVAVDGAQSVGMLPTDVRDIGADVYCASPHKWLQAPKGLGLMYVRESVQATLRPMWVTWGQRRWEGTGRIFEDYGTRNLAEVLTLGDAIDFQNAIGAAAKEQRYEALWQQCRLAARQTPNVVWRSPETWSLATSLYAVEIIDEDSRDVFDRLRRTQGFVVRAFRTRDLNTVRLSPNTFNTEEEIGRFFGAVRA